MTQKLSISALQSNIVWLDKAANLKKLNRQLSEIEQADLVLLSETFATGFAIDIDDCEETPDLNPLLSWMQEKAVELNTVIAGSMLVRHKNKKANRFYWVRPGGEVDYYDKRHLFRMGNEQVHVVAGEQRKVFSVNGVRILPQVCYDLRFPVWSRNLNDYDVMVNVANWPAVRRVAWDALLKARAIENQCFVVGVNRVGNDGREVAHSGGTAVYDYLGECSCMVEDHKEGLLQTQLDIKALQDYREKFPAYLDADKFTILETSK